MASLAWLGWESGRLKVAGEDGSGCQGSGLGARPDTLHPKP